MNSDHRVDRGFTLVELLVVLAIISLISSTLLPVMTRVRRSANTIACAANLRTALQAMQMYAGQYRNAIPGSPNTSGAFLLDSKFNQARCPALSQIWDYQAPLARILRYNFEEGAAINQRVARFSDLLKRPVFSCPENDMLATAFTGTGGPNFPATRWISYCAASGFLYVSFGAEGVVGIQKARTEYDVPADYLPRLGRVGNLSKKIYLADGGRFTTTAAPTMDLDYLGGFGGAYADVGAWSSYSRAWDRSNAPGNGGKGAKLDPRAFSYRHGDRQPGGHADSFRFNAGFFDGHVETLGDLEGANPDYWAPRGAKLAATDPYPDVARKYFTGKPDPYVVP
jgi:prepilin-type N-terminal cleavage/methylation domain-containing protein/prepilin-type processing-associated H-X9-DG protein